MLPLLPSARLKSEAVGVCTLRTIPKEEILGTWRELQGGRLITWGRVIPAVVLGRVSDSVPSSGCMARAGEREQLQT